MQKIAFVGMGSIGTRHLNNVVHYLERNCQSYTIDLYRSGNRPLNPEIQQKISREILLSDTAAIQETYDAVWITNPTSAHYETIRRFVKAAKAMFIEKPVFETPDVDFAVLNLKPDGIYYVACPLRYHPVIEYVKEYIPLREVYAARAISSSYLPDWRPGTDYRTCYSARRDMGGGVDIDLIHEWDYLVHLFGPMRSGYAIRDQISNLELDSYDIAVYVARAEHTIVELHLDYFGRKSIRQLQLFLPDETIECDILNGTIEFCKAGKQISVNCERDGYQRKEIEHFFNIMAGRCSNDSAISDALNVLRYARGEFPR